SMSAIFGMISTKYKFIFLWSLLRLHCADVTSAVSHQSLAEVACTGSSSDSVETLVRAFSAACRVCQGRIAHLTRVGKSRMPEKTVSRPRWFGCSGSSLPVAMSRNSWISVSASGRVLPLTAAVIIDADALQIAQDSP